MGGHYTMFGHDDDQQTPAAQPTDQAAASYTAPATAAAFANPPAPAVQDAGLNGDAADSAATPLPAIDEPAARPGAPTGLDANGLLDIKQQALQQLSPLVGHLEQSPEEKFRTTMMMIQASDDQGLIKDAYAAAQAISDEKARAQALLDVVNEINYFTQHQG